LELLDDKKTIVFLVGHEKARIECAFSPSELKHASPWFSALSDPFPEDDIVIASIDLSSFRAVLAYVTTGSVYGSDSDWSDITLLHVAWDYFHLDMDDFPCPPVFDGMINDGSKKYLQDATLIGPFRDLNNVRYSPSCLLLLAVFLHCMP
jgi:hypothetical protein